MDDEGGTGRFVVLVLQPPFPASFDGALGHTD